jgi:hypothetical protein
VIGPVLQTLDDERAVFFTSSPGSSDIGVGLDA